MGWASEVHEAAQFEKKGRDWTEHDYATLRGSVVIDGVAYPETRLREIIRERHTLAGELTYLREENVRLKLEIERLREVARRQQWHLQKRTSALCRVVAERRPYLR